MILRNINLVLVGIWRYVVRVLLIEDDTLTAKGIESLLRKEGVVVDSTSFGQYGLEVGKVYD